MSTLHDLSVRRPGSRDCSPRGVSDSPGLLSLRASKRAVILIHGFANSAEKANASYADLIREVENSIWPHRIGETLNLFGYHWPGDHPSRFKNTASFSTRIGVAASAGHHLGALLESLNQRPEVVIVAHSLGCRVALAALDYLNGGSQSGARVSRVILMAAAVPVNDCEGTGPFVARHAAHYTVLHSRRDRILQWCFPPGQFLFDEAATAVGRDGEPGGLRWDDRIDTRLGHSQYWSSTVAAALLAPLLPVTPPRGVARRALDARSSHHEPEDAARTLPGRSLPCR
jgi:hypothetical protein